ncbi:type III secretion effector protein [Pseudomonas sp. A25(2017)]|uniref:SpaN/EivJ family type III secretion system needle length determinant n=1 Tax=Pseudomonas sp. A25(2017) TaxID=1945865 RepID=UPI0009879A33|nr:type III secretion effector protein [Pseudomonas sp. A25(2017)]OOG85025.1 type III secretion effector protein [Pseudomonas sp. A25(2017)]
MKEVCVPPTRLVHALEPVDEDPLDELQDLLIPVPEDELPQGVLDLVVALVRQQRPPMETARVPAWQAMSVGQETQALDRDETQPIARETRAVEPYGRRLPARETIAVPQAGPLFSEPTQRPSPQRLPPVVAVIDKATVPRDGVSIEPLPMAPVIVPRARSAPRIDEQLPQAPLSFQGARHGSPVAPVALPAPALPPALPPTLPPALEVMVEALPDTGRGLLQIPFSRGAASGQITISRLPEEPTRNLTLSPSNALVLEQLKAPFELAREPAWRLADSGGEQPRQGSHQAPDEEQDEQGERPA